MSAGETIVIVIGGILLGLTALFVWFASGAYAVKLFDLAFLFQEDTSAGMRRRATVVLFGVFSVVAAYTVLASIRIRARIPSHWVMHLEPLVDFVQPKYRRDRSVEREIIARQQAEALMVQHRQRAEDHFAMSVELINKRRLEPVAFECGGITTPNEAVGRLSDLIETHRNMRMVEEGLEDLYLDYINEKRDLRRDERIEIAKAARGVEITWPWGEQHA